MSWRTWALRPVVYRALLGPDAISGWRAPAGMRALVHTFDARGGDAFYGRILRLVPDAQVVEQITFEADDPLASITMMTTLSDAAVDVTTVLVAHDGIPDVASVAEAEIATRMALAKLVELVEQDQPPR